MALKQRTRRIGIVVIVLVIVLIGACAWYVNDYYRAIDVDEAFASSAQVTVEHTSNGWRFDGPGTQDALVFYPGAKVEAASYAPLMRQLAEEGVDTFLVQMPFNLAFFDINAIETLMDDARYAYNRWYVSGHSLGGAMAAHYAAQNPDQLSGLVLLAAYPTSSLRTADFPVLTIYGSNDTVVRHDRIEERLALMPVEHTEIVIDGGNHAQFGSYGAQAGDGAASIDPDVQRTQTTHAIMTLVHQQAHAIPSEGRIDLYGEQHGVSSIMDAELKAWGEHYANGTRDLFVELPFYSAEFLNLWMAAADDAILEQLYQDWDGTAIHTSDTLAFYRAIKERYPQTVFHGTDVGHQYATTGSRYLAYLESQGQLDSDEYRAALACIEQGKRYYASGDDGYRENALIDNFVRAFDALAGADVVGIYGSAHTGLESSAQGAPTTPSMAHQLAKRYGAQVHSEDLTSLARTATVIRTDNLTVGDTVYEASYFGNVDLTAILPGYRSRAFWRLEDAYDDFKNLPTTGDVLPYNNYPMAIEEGQVFVVEYTLTNGTTSRYVYRSDGTTWQGQPVTVEVHAE